MTFKGFTKQLAFAVAASAFGAAFQHCYNIHLLDRSVIGPISFWIAETMAHRNGTWNDTAAHKDEGGNPSYYYDIYFSFGDSITIIIRCLFVTFYVGAMIGCAFIGFVANHFGRKRGLLFNNVFVLLAVVCMSSSKAVSSYELLLFGRFLIGFNVGLNCGLVFLYLTEIAPVNLRGAVGSMYMVFFTITYLVLLAVDIVNLNPPAYSNNYWPMLLALPIIPAVFQILTLSFCPESPKYLLFTKKRESEAQTSLLWLRDSVDIQEEMAGMKTEFEAIKLMPKGVLKNMIIKKELRMPLIIAAHVMVAQFVSGIFDKYVFWIIIMMMAEIREYEIALILTVGLVRIIMTVVSVFLVEKLGRRKLLLVGYAGMALAASLLAGLLEDKHAHTIHSIQAIICAVLAVVYTIMFACGPNSIPWFYVSELFNQSARPTATALVLFVYWNACLSSYFSFGLIWEMFETRLIWMFAVLNVWFFFFVWLKAPETNNKPIENICATFKSESNRQIG